jgi:fatty acid desaturase
LGLLSARSMLPRGVAAIALGFAAAGVALLFAAGTNALTWWVMPLTFGIGQVAIGISILRDEAAHGAEAAA